MSLNCAACRLQAGKGIADSFWDFSNPKFDTMPLGTPRIGNPQVKSDPV
jgi:hypothetical protein